MGDAVRRIYWNKYDESAVCLSKAANVVRNKILKHSYMLKGHLDTLVLRTAPPPSSLLALIRMILHPITSDATSSPTQAALKIAKLLQFDVATKIAN